MNARPAVNWVLLIGSLVTAAVLSELSVRLFMPQELIPLASWDSTGLTVPDSLMCHRLRRNFTTTWARDVVVSTNSLGIRDHEYGPKQDDELRILSLGDSYAFGFGVELGDSYPKRVERELSARLPTCRVSVINAAMSGHSTQHQIREFGELAPLLEPDLVLATFVASNDIYENSVFEDQLRQGVLNPVGPISKHSHLARLIRRKLGPYTLRLVTWWGPNIDETVALLTALEGRFDEAGVPYLMIVIPARHQVQPDVSRLSKLLGDLGLGRLITRQNRRIIDHFESERVPYVDLLPVLRARGASEPVYFLDDPHTNRIGHQVIAEAVVDALEPELTTLARDLGCLRD